MYAKIRKDKIMKENLINQKFERLLVIEQAENILDHSQYKCICDCGNIKIVKREYLIRGETSSCGCLKKELVSKQSMNNDNAVKYDPREATARYIWSSNYKKEGLSFEDYYKISQNNCHFCGASPAHIANRYKNDKRSTQATKENGNFIYNRFKKIDKKLPFVASNIVAYCGKCK